MKPARPSPRVSPKTDLLSESVIREMTRLADRHGAINLAQGFPDFPTPRVFKAAAIRAIREDHNQYALTWGSPALRQAISDKARKFNGIDYDPDDNITVTCGSTEAMMATVLALAGPGDEVIVLEPAYENYRPAAVLTGATPVPVPLGPNFTLEEEKLKAAFGPKTRLVLVNTPHNPSGKVFSEVELRTIADLCEDHNAVAVTDEIYEHIIYDGKEHISLATLGAMSERTVTISGISKTYTATGWRVGYAMAPRKLTRAIRKVHDYMTVCAPAPFQEAASIALRSPPSFYRQLAATYQKKRDFMVGSLKELGFNFFKPEGAYYILADFRGLRGVKDTDFAKALTTECGVAVVPGSSFYADAKKGEGFVRFGYSKKDSTLKKAVARMKSYLKT